MPCMILYFLIFLSFFDKHKHIRIFSRRFSSTHAADHRTELPHDRWLPMRLKKQSEVEKVTLNSNLRWKTKWERDRFTGSDENRFFDARHDRKIERKKTEEKIFDDKYWKWNSLLVAEEEFHGFAIIGVRSCLTYIHVILNKREIE